MKRELKFFAYWLKEYTAVIGAVTLILIAGMLFFGNGKNLFTTYASMYPIFVALFPLIFAMSAKSFVSMAISFGARRMPCVAGMEIAYSAFALVMTGMSYVVRLVYNRINSTEDMARVADFGVLMPLLEFSLAFFLIQIAFITASFEKSLPRVLMLIFAAMIPMGGVLGVVIGASREPELYSVIAKIMPYLIVGFLAAGAVLAFIVRILYKKVVYTA